MAYNFAAARAAGLTDQEIQNYLQSKNQPVSQALEKPQQQPESEGFDWTSLLPIIGAIGGSFLPGLGNIAGGAVGAGAGALLKQGIKGEQFNPGEVAKETALGGVGGVLGKGIGMGAKLLGKGVTGAAENVGVKALRLSPSQLTKFSTRHGEDVGQFLKTEGALGKGVKELSEQHIQPLQDNFNAIAKKSGLTAQPDDFIKNVDAAAEELLQAGGSENAALAEKIRNEALYLLEHDLVPAKFDISKVDSLRRTFASKVNWNNPEKAVTDYALADALRKTTIDTANKGGFPGLKEIGIKLSKFRDLEKSATAQENLGRGSMPLGITKWLSLVAGGAAGAGGGPGGMLAGIATNAVINSPRFLQGATKVSARAGGALEGGIPRASQAMGQIGARGLPSDIQTAQAAELSPSGMKSSDLALAADQPEAGAINSADPDMIRKAFFLAMLKNPKQASTLKTMYEFGFPQAKFTANQEKGFQKTADAESIAKQIEQSYKSLGTTGRISGLFQKAGGAVGANPKATAYEALRSASIGPLARAISGEVGVLTDRDVARAEALLPNLTDTTQEANLKLKQLKAAISARRENVRNLPKSNDLSIPQPASLGI